MLTHLFWGAGEAHQADRLRLGQRPCPCSAHSAWEPRFQEVAPTLPSALVPGTGLRLHTGCGGAVGGKTCLLLGVCFPYSRTYRTANFLLRDSHRTAPGGHVSKQQIRGPVQTWLAKQYIQVTPQQQTNSSACGKVWKLLLIFSKWPFFSRLIWKRMTLNTIWGQSWAYISCFYFISPILFNDLLIRSLVPILSFT